jgi:hypothetical protein
MNCREPERHHNVKQQHLRLVNTIQAMRDFPLDFKLQVQGLEILSVHAATHMQGQGHSSSLEHHVHSHMDVYDPPHIYMYPLIDIRDRCMYRCIS